MTARLRCEGRGLRVTFAAALAALALLVTTGGAAVAHANYVKSVPEADARLARPPTEVRITFSEAVVPRFSEIRVLDVAGKRVDRGELGAVDESTLRAPLQPVGEGGYTVAWRVLSTVDGHETRGSFAFAVGDAPLPAPAEVGGASRPTAPDVAGRALSFAGVALLLGASLFAVAVARRAEERRGVAWLSRAGGAVIAAGGLLLLAQAGGIPLLFDSRLGQLFALRVALGLAAIATASPRAHLALGAFAAAAISLQSHAAAYGTALAVAVDLAHVLAASAWSGALVALGLVALPRLRAPDPSAARYLGALVGRFSTLGVACVALLAATGVAQAAQRLLHPLDLIETPYGLTILAKSALLATAVALASLNLLRHGPALRAARAAGRARDLLLLGVRGEVALVAAVVALSGLLTALVPPAAPAGAAYTGVAHDAGLRIELLARSTQPGANRYVVRLREGLAGAPRDVDKVALRFTMVEHDMGEQELVAPERGPGEYAVDGSAMSMFGTWNVLVVVRRAAREESRARFVVSATAPAEAGAAARVLQAGTLTLVVFSEPSAPFAGQPVTLTIVAIDPKGDPVSDARIAATVEGTSVEAIAEGNGRYRVEMPGLPAGERRVAIEVLGPAGGRATYALAVTP